MTRRPLITLLPRRHAADSSLLSEAPREGRHERRAHHAFREQVADEVWDAERDVEGIDGVPAPNRYAMTCSRTRPRTRLVIVAAPIRPADRARLLDADKGGKNGVFGGPSTPRGGWEWASHWSRRRPVPESLIQPSFLFTASLTALPSAVLPARCVIAAFMTLPKSLADVTPVSATAAATAASMSSAVADGG